MAFQRLVLVFFVALAIGNVESANGAGGLASGQPFFNDTAGFATISAGAGIAAYSFLVGLVMAHFASGLTAQASASRLMYAMGRDSVLPKAVFGRISEKFHTLVVNLVITASWA